MIWRWMAFARIRQKAISPVYVATRRGHHHHIAGPYLLRFVQEAA
jgi:hypothetical protein